MINLGFVSNKTKVKITNQKVDNFKTEQEYVHKTEGTRIPASILDKVDWAKPTDLVTSLWVNLFILRAQIIILAAIDFLFLLCHNGDVLRVALQLHVTLRMRRDK